MEERKCVIMEYTVLYVEILGCEMVKWIIVFLKDIQILSLDVVQENLSRTQTMPFGKRY